MVTTQGGDVASLRDPASCPRATFSAEVCSPAEGVFLGVDARPAGEWIHEAGGGRMRAGQAVDPRVGLEILVDRGERV